MTPLPHNLRITALAVLGALAVQACSRTPSPELAVEYAGCAAVLTGPVCLMPETRTLRLWLPDPTQGAVGVRGGKMLAPAMPLSGGQRLAVSVEEDAGVLRVSDDGGREWRLALAWTDPVPALQQARELQLAGEFDAAFEVLAPAEAALDELGRARVAHRRARIAVARGDRLGADQYLQAAIDGFRHAGALSELVDNATLRTFLLIEDRRFAEARSVLDALPAHWGAPAESLYLADYYEGTLAYYAGDARHALRHLEAAVRRSERLDLERERRAAEQMLAWQLQRVGRRNEADALFVKLEREAPATLDPCERALLLNNIAWNRILAFEAAESAPDPAPLLEQAFDLFDSGCARYADERANLHLSQALASLHAGEQGRATQHLAEARALAPESQLRLSLWSRDIEARAALAARKAEDALAIYVALEQEAGEHYAPELRWRATVGRALALEGLGRRDEAMSAFALAETRLDEDALQVPIQAGREGFAARREWSTRHYLVTLLAAGRVDDALAVARRSRSRVLRSLRREDRLEALTPAERARWYAVMAAYARQRDELARSVGDDWRLAADDLARVRVERAQLNEVLLRQLDDVFSMLDGRRDNETLPERTSGELLLLYHPLETGWAGFAQSDAGTQAVLLDCVGGALDREALSNCLLGPFHAQLAGADRIRVLPLGLLRDVDFHALPFRGEVLLAAAPVVYGLDMSGARRGRPGDALVVGDPRGDLPAARREAGRVSEVLERHGVRVAATLLGPEATGAKLRQHLGEVDLFHYAGHASFGGPAGWDSVLPLAAGAAFGIGDILALARAPGFVVLSGCESGRSSAKAAAESLGLAHAFLAAGAVEVLAAARPVGDRAAADLVDAFYERLRDDASPDVALQRAQLELLRRQPAADWASFRLIAR